MTGLIRCALPGEALVCFSRVVFLAILIHQALRNARARHEGVVGFINGVFLLSTGEGCCYANPVIAPTASLSLAQDGSLDFVTDLCRLDCFGVRVVFSSRVGTTFGGEF